MKTPFFKTPYNHDTDAESDRTGLACKDPSLTLQSQSEEANINTIVRRFGLTGELPIEHQRQAEYLDLTNEPNDFTDMQINLAQARARFYELPAVRRADYLNNPAKWLEDVNSAIDRGDRDTLRAMGVQIEPAPKPPDPQTDTQKVSVSTIDNK
ncbi:MAG: internal scaffolding protein [Microvirus sp.]|nr:MAG: internal scaffolding protein [Microvirus sp.]